MSRDDREGEETETNETRQEAKERYYKKYVGMRLRRDE